MITIDMELIAKLEGINVSDICNKALHKLVDKEEIEHMTIEELQKLKAQIKAKKIYDKEMEKINNG